MRLFFTAALFTLLCVSSALAQKSQAQLWTLVQDQSQITYSNPASGGTVPIIAYNAHIAFDPKRLSESSIMIAIDFSTLLMDAKEVDPAALAKLEPTTDILEESPATAIFVSDRIESGSDNVIQVTGRLTANKRTREVTVPFAVTLGQHPATKAPMLTLTGELTVNRNEFTTQAMGTTGPALIPFQMRISGIMG